MHAYQDLLQRRRGCWRQGLFPLTYPEQAARTLKEARRSQLGFPQTRRGAVGRVRPASLAILCREPCTIHRGPPFMQTRLVKLTLHSRRKQTVQ